MSRPADCTDSDDSDDSDEYCTTYTHYCTSYTDDCTAYRHRYTALCPLIASICIAPLRYLRCPLQYLRHLLSLPMTITSLPMPATALSTTAAYAQYCTDYADYWHISSYLMHQLVDNPLPPISLIRSHSLHLYLFRVVNIIYLLILTRHGTFVDAPRTARPEYLIYIRYVAHDSDRIFQTVGRSATYRCHYLFPPKNQAYRAFTNSIRDCTNCQSHFLVAFYQLRSTIIGASWNSWLHMRSQSY
jgi:hypothetical protein